jgi:type I restriction enzyme S subunit
MESRLNTLPPQWPLVSLETISEVGAGNGAPQGDAYFARGTYPFVRMQDVGRCQTPYITTTLDRLNDLALEKHNLRKWPAGSLLIPKSGASVALNKRALLSEPAYVVSHLAVLVPGRLVHPEYLYYLSCTLDMTRLALDPAYPSLRTSDLAKVRVPLPSLSEQQRIVEILQEAEEIRRLRAEAEAKTAELIPAIYHDMFLASPGRGQWKSTTVADIAAKHENAIRTGPFGSDLLHSEFVESGIPVLGIDNAVANRFRWVERRYISPEKFSGLQRYRVFPGDVMVTIMGTVGRVAVAPADLPESISTKHLCVITCDLKQVLPNFLWATLLYDPSVRAQTRAVAKGAIMEGWNSKIIRTLKFPLPPLELQEYFDAKVQEALTLEENSDSLVLAEALPASLAAHAFSGELTANWREAHHVEIALEAKERDAALDEAGAIASRFRPDTIQEMESILDLPVEGIYSNLNRDQTRLLREIGRIVGSVRHARYFSAKELGEYLTDGPLRRNPQLIEGHLAVLAARGLIISVSCEEQTQDTGEFVFGNAYRLPMKGYEPAEAEERDANINDASRLRELERLAARLEKEQMLT